MSSFAKNKLILAYNYGTIMTLNINFYKQQLLYDH